jgi:hypothetical protein
MCENSTRGSDERGLRKRRSWRGRRRDWEKRKRRFRGEGS